MPTSKTIATPAFALCALTAAHDCLLGNELHGAVKREHQRATSQRVRFRVGQHQLAACVANSVDLSAPSSKQVVHREFDAVKSASINVGESDHWARKPASRVETSRFAGE